MLNTILNGIAFIVLIIFGALGVAVLSVYFSMFVLFVIVILVMSGLWLVVENSWRWIKRRWHGKRKASSSRL